MRLLTLLSLSVFCNLGCGVRAPLAEFTGSTITNATPEAIEMEVEFEVANTNDLPIRLMMYSYTVTANGRTIFRGKNSAQFTVPRWSLARNSIPIVISRDAISDSENIAWELTGTLGYVPPSAFAEALRTSGLWETFASVNAHGVVSMPN